jgi:tRNA(adenine34) deaminase
MTDTPLPAIKQSHFTGWVSLALAQAEYALDAGEAPIGCVLLREDGSVVASAYNTMVATGCLIAHAEINALTAAAGKTVRGERLTMVSSLEPCVMCTGAAMEAGVATIVFALRAPADAGSTRVRPPSSPEASMPDIFGDVLADSSRKLFVDWLSRHEGDASRESQRRFVSQLLALTAT